VYFVEGHNFPVEWHLRFGVELREKALSTLLVTIHRRLENLHVGMPLVQKWLSKTPYALCRCCRGVLDLQLCYLPQGALQLKMF
jgi:hypothetical protein